MEPSQRPYAAIVVLLTACASLLVLTVYFGIQSQGLAHTATPRLDERDRLALDDHMAAAAAGLYDSHPDADVGRMLLPNLDARRAFQIAVSTNRFGLREKEFSLPKTKGTTRIILLGDSYIFGMNVAAEDRVGVFLERYLRERAASDKQDNIEVLHVGVPSWNLLNECAYVRRHLDLLAPDLVIHVSVQNDLDDSHGVRGFGTLGKLTPRSPEQADTVISSYYPQAAFALGNIHGQLARGLDWEGRHRFDEAAQAIRELRDELHSSGAQYLHVFLWGSFNRAAGEYLRPALPPREVAWLPGAFFNDLSYRLSNTDVHWNRAGHARVGHALYGWITRRNLLPDLGLAQWPEATAVAREMGAVSIRELSVHKDFQEWQDLPWFVSELDLRQPTPEALSSIHGGVLPGGLVGAYASLFLRRGDATRLVIEGECLDRSELNGAELTVHLDETEVARFVIQRGEPIHLDIPLPDDIKARPFIGVRFSCDDYLYVGSRLRKCATMRLHRVALVD